MPKNSNQKQTISNQAISKQQKLGKARIKNKTTRTGFKPRISKYKGLVLTGKKDREKVFGYGEEVVKFGGRCRVLVILCL